MPSSAGRYRDTPKSWRDFDAADYARRFEAQRRARTWALSGMVVALLIALSIGGGVVVSAGVAVALFALAAATVGVIGLRDRRRRAALRAAGQPESWAALLPAYACPEVLATRPKTRPDAGLLGYFTLGTPTAPWSATWTPGKGTATFYNLEPVTWDASWRVQTEPAFGFGRQKHVTLVRDGYPDSHVDVWLRHAGKFPA